MIKLSRLRFQGEASMWYQGSFFKYITAIILVLLVILLLYHIQFLFDPLIEFVATLFLPILLAGILYYVLRPLMHLLERVHMPRTAAILLLYVMLSLVIIAILSSTYPILLERVGTIAIIPTDKIQNLHDRTIDLIKLLHLNVFSTTDVKEILTTALYKVNTWISDNLMEAVRTITRFTVLILITPFILFYLLKDGHYLYHIFLNAFPTIYQKEVKLFLRDIDRTLSIFITGQLMVALSIGIFLFIGYLLIGLENAFILALLGTLFVTIPVIGSFIAIIPALFMGWVESPYMALKVVLVMLTAQLIEAQLISPLILAKRLHIHPLTLMLILLASGSLYGILGLFLATPLYALGKVILTDFSKIYYHRAKKWNI
jgi:predicted PurR-regulated permease PerM